MFGFVKATDLASGAEAIPVFITWSSASPPNPLQFDSFQIVTYWLMREIEPVSPAKAIDMHTGQPVDGEVVSRGI
ncbi:hypothetical protein AWB78_03923 [Caballeronia calidae]|uniref:Uncharacterized protein n=1 Tax=Caballeronia calidae TaxID=1777139 RepID=A0A158CI52_9BURK|nr:hypothetical protein [Caballeronia calidae]SAK81566.1 hypothetical protein AWB78_03923 [Caballeronia calidae]